MMPLQSMTGFARTEGLLPHGSWRWELRSVNGKGLDLRFRLPPGYDMLETELRGVLAGRITRGSITANLVVERKAAQPEIRVNEAALAQLAALGNSLAQRSGLAAPTLDGLLAVRGMVEMVEASETEEEHRIALATVKAGFTAALDDLIAMREAEGRSLRAILIDRLDALAALTRAAAANPARQPEAVRARLAQGLAALATQSPALEPARLHQEALLLAAKADIREELDRLFAHEAAARALLTETGAVGRRLDFLAQEFNREANTLCSKANDISLTATGLELKATIEQIREQVQNLE